MWRKEAAMANFIKAVRKPIQTVEIDINDDNAVLKSYPNHLVRVVVKGIHKAVTTDQTWKDDISLEAFVLSNGATLPIMAPAMNDPSKTDAMGKNVLLIRKSYDNENYFSGRVEDAIARLKQGLPGIWRGKEDTGTSVATQGILIIY